MKVQRERGIFKNHTLMEEQSLIPPIFDSENTGLELY